MHRAVPTRIDTGEVNAGHRPACGRRQCRRQLPEQTQPARSRGFSIEGLGQCHAVEYRSNVATPSPDTMTSYPHDPIDRFIQHYPVDGGMDLAVLRIHLLIEELLFAIISARFPYPSRIEKAKLTFSQKTHLAKASFHYDSSEGWIWGAIDALNAARTSMAHHLDPHRTSIKAAAFIDLVKASVKHPHAQRPEKVDPLLWAGFVLHGELARIGDVKGERRNLLAGLLIEPSPPSGTVPIIPE